jgi:glutaredoxin-related protein
MLQRVSDRVRTLVAGALASESGNKYKPIKMVREVLGTANDLVGRPFCTQAELDERRGGTHDDGAAMLAREVAPVMLYVDGKDQRSKKKIIELLQGRDIKFTELDVSDDEATRSWAITAAKSEEFPLVFVAGEAIGGLHEVTQADVNGILKKKVFG